MQIKDAKSGKMRDETDDERKAREDAAAAGGDEEGDDADEGATLTTLKAQLSHWKEEARKWEKRAKDNFASKTGVPWDEVTTAAQKYADDQAKNKSETERAAAAEQAATTRAAKAERDLLLLTIATKKGLTPAQAKRLNGETEEEIEADADELVKSFKRSDDEEETGSTAGRVTRRPNEIVRSGSGKQKEPPFDAKKVVDAAMGVTT